MGTDTFIGDYTYLTRISITHINTVRTMIRFFNQYNYTSLTILQDQFNSFYAELSTVMESLLRKEGLVIYSASKLIPFRANEITDTFIPDTLLAAVLYSRGNLSLNFFLDFFKLFFKIDLI